MEELKKIMVFDQDGTCPNLEHDPAAHEEFIAIYYSLLMALKAAVLSTARPYDGVTRFEDQFKYLDHGLPIGFCNGVYAVRDIWRPIRDKSDFEFYYPFHRSELFSIKEYLIDNIEQVIQVNTHNLLGDKDFEFINNLKLSKEEQRDKLNSFLNEVTETNPPRIMVHFKKGFVINDSYFNCCVAGGDGSEVMFMPRGVNKAVFLEYLESSGYEIICVGGDQYQYDPKNPVLMGNDYRAMQRGLEIPDCKVVLVGDQDSSHIADEEERVIRIASPAHLRKALERLFIENR